MNRIKYCYVHKNINVNEGEGGYLRTKNKNNKK